MNYFIFLFLVAYLFLSIKRKYLAFLLLIFLLPAYQLRFSIFSIPFTMLEGMIFVLFSTWFLQNFKNIFERLKSKVKGDDSGIVNYPFGTEIALWVFFAWLGIWVANFSSASLGIWKAYFFEPALVFILFFNIFTESRRNKKDFLLDIIYTFSASALLISLYAIFQKFSGFGIVNPFWANEATRRVTGIFDYPNALGLYLSPLIIIIGAAIVYVWKNRDLLYLSHYKIIFLFVAAFSSILAVFFAKSEGAIVAVLLSFILGALYLFFQKIKREKIFSFAILPLVFIFIFLSPLFYLFVVPEHSYPDFGNSIINKIYDKVALKDFSGEVRKQQWRETIEMMSDKNRWFWGAGLSYYQGAITEYHREGIYFNKERDDDFRRKIVIFDDKYKSEHWFPVEIYMYPHNLLLNFWTELGLFAVILFIWIVLKFFFIARNLLNSKKEKGEQYLILGFAFAMLALLIHGIVDVPYFKNDLALIFWLLIAALTLFNLDSPNRDIIKEKDKHKSNDE